MLWSVWMVSFLIAGAPGVQWDPMDAWAWTLLAAIGFDITLEMWYTR